MTSKLLYNLHGSLAESTAQTFFLSRCYWIDSLICTDYSIRVFVLKTLRVKIREKKVLSLEAVIIFVTSEELAMS